MRKLYLIVFARSPFLFHLPQKYKQTYCRTVELKRSRYIKMQDYFRIKIEAEMQVYVSGLSCINSTIKIPREAKQILKYLTNMLKVPNMKYITSRNISYCGRAMPRIHYKGNIMVVRLRNCIELRILQKRRYAWEESIITGC